jgi:hypothetical protein
VTFLRHGSVWNGGIEDTKAFESTKKHTLAAFVTVPALLGNKGGIGPWLGGASLS